MMLRLQTVFFWLAFGSSTATSNGQMVWKNVDSLFQPLPPSVHIYESTTPLDGKPNRAFYVAVDMKDKSLELTTQTGRGKRFTPAEYFQREGSPLLVVNGTFFSFANNSNRNLVIRRGMLQAFNEPAVRMKSDSTQYYYLTRGAIGINKKREVDVAWTYTDTALRYAYAMLNGPVVASGPNPDPSWPELASQISGGGRKKVKWKMETAIGGGPVLLEMGRIAITSREERMFVNGENDRHPRTAMGYTLNHELIILMVEGRNPGQAEGATLAQMAQVFMDLKCHEALNLDGGGSSCLLINGKETIKPSDKTGQRPVPAVFMIYHRP